MLSTETHARFNMSYISILEEFCVTGISSLNSLNYACTIEAAHFEDLFNTLISIINGNTD